jgi:hypothetical protein
MDADALSLNFRSRLTRGVISFGALFAVSVLLAGCGGGEPCEDQITLGSGGCGGADAVTANYPIFYVKRPVSTATPTAGGTLRVRVNEFQPGADLYMRSSASPSAGEVNLTGSLTQGLGDVRDVDVSHNGRRVVFAMRYPFQTGVILANQTSSWNIWEYNIDTGNLRRVIVDDAVANGPTPTVRYHDRFPHYSADDQRIIFSSTRQRTSQTVLLDEGKSQFQAQDETNVEPISNIHVMDTAGVTIRQLTFNQAHDMDSAVLANGQIAFTRWDASAAQQHVALYRMNPDGSGTELLYGKQNITHASRHLAAAPNDARVQFLRPRLLHNGLLSVIARPLDGRDIHEGGDLVQIDVNAYVEYHQSASSNADLPGPGHTRLAPAISVNTGPVRSPGGRFRSVFPLNDSSNRLLVSWSQCRLINGVTIVPCTAENLAITPELPEAQPLYGLYILNVAANTQIPIALPQEGIVMTDVVAGAPRSNPPLILDRLPSVDYAPQLESQSAGILDIRSVYDIRGEDTTAGGIGPMRNPLLTTAAQRPARFLRIEKAVSLPNNQVRNIRGTSFSPSGRFMREILGYAPIEPDGSVRVKVPANVAFRISILDANGRRITDATPGRSPTHRNWLHVRPGEVMTCNGCHTPQVEPTLPATTPLTRSHGRRGAFNSANPGAPANGSFPNTVAALTGTVGQTMAQIRAEDMCQLNNGSSACNPSVNMIFADYWTDPAVRAPDTSFGRCYTATSTDVRIDPLDTSITYNCADAGATSNASVLTTPAPVRDSCENTWASQCRIVINYTTHIQPLWDLDRLVDPMDPMSTNNRCTTCHSPTNAMGAVQVPGRSLDLRNSADNNQVDHLVSYRQLLFPRRAQELNATMTALQDECLDVDPVTGVCLQFRDFGAPMLSLNARGSPFFTTMSTIGTTVDHRPFMNPAELRLISEWLDIGAQYYNDPFLAPTN